MRHDVWAPKVYFGFQTPRDFHTNAVVLLDPLTPLAATIILLRERPILELDELGSFVGDNGHGVWIWVARERQTRHIVGLAFGDHSAETCNKLWQSVPADYCKRAICYADLLASYGAVLPSKRHRAVGKETGKQRRLSGSTTHCANAVPSLCPRPFLSASTSCGIRYVSGYSSITTIVGSNSGVCSHQFRLHHYRNSSVPTLTSG